MDNDINFLETLQLILWSIMTMCFASSPYLLYRGYRAYLDWREVNKNNNKIEEEYWRKNR